VGNMLAGSSDYTANLAPGAVAERAIPEVAAAAVRMVALGLALVTLLGSAMMARSRAGLPAAALLGVITMLLLPASLWYHYLAILLPFAAMAWPRGSSLERVLLLGSAIAVTLGLAWLPGALAGATAMAAVSLFVLWPRSRQVTGSTLPEPDHGAI